MNIDTSEFHRHIIRAIRQRITVSAPSISFLLIAGISLAWTVSSWAENKCTVKDSYAHIQNPALVLMDSRMMPQTSPSLLVSTSEAVTMGLPLSRPPLPELGSVHIGSSVCAQGLLPEDCNCSCRRSVGCCQVVARKALCKSRRDNPLRDSVVWRA